ncbi:hypothetical protein DS884_11775 [Tenacibaculum sp. E3R01]|uniref:DUF5995 family protein n=1 Tax=Tenacibaculum sp. E3R01 TaxID=2267227 RepID=UPI000DEA4726|nr:DUF5995 family protein [Tenacibaculum sp. E3R01]RBW57252.1 hypothetical protein DS884_11775 [Tenacibaculum sp. E3R01]
MPPIETIDDVIETLQNIIEDAIKNESTLGYFAALYLKVTKKVKQGISENFFEDGKRMEKLDVIFAKRYITAYYDYKENKPISASWEKAFSISTKYWPIVLQHLLIGMNAHINLDLGIAAAQVSEGQPIDNLKGDFNKINVILSSLVNEVEQDLSTIWPFLKKILKFTHKIDSFLIDFSMKLARDGAWNFAVKLSSTPEKDKLQSIKERDEKVSQKASIIINPGLIPQIIFMIVRVGERGSIAKKVGDLMQK